MLPEVTYEDYQSFGGTMGEADWAKALPHALAAVKLRMSLYHEPNPDWPWQVEAYKRAVCAAADVDKSHGLTGGLNGGRGGFSIGSYSQSGGTSSDELQKSAYDDDMDRAIRAALAGSGLLCQIIR